MQESKNKSPVNWTKVEEIRLFKWMTLFKPAGVHKHFHMMCLLERMNKPDEFPIKLLQNDKGQSRTFTASNIWEQLSKYYNLQNADEVENRPYELEEQSSDDEYRTVQPLQNTLLNCHDFELSWDEYGALMLDHAKEVEEPSMENGVNALPAINSVGADKNLDGLVSVSSEGDKKQKNRRALRTSIRVTRSRRKDIAVDSTESIEDIKDIEDLEDLRNVENVENTKAVDDVCTVDNSTNNEGLNAVKVSFDPHENTSVEKKISTESTFQDSQGTLSDIKDENANKQLSDISEKQNMQTSLNSVIDEANAPKAITAIPPEQVPQQSDNKTSSPFDADEDTGADKTAPILTDTDGNDQKLSISGEDTEEEQPAKLRRIQESAEEEDTDSPATRTRRKSITRASTRLSNRLRNRK